MGLEYFAFDHLKEGVAFLQDGLFRYLNKAILQYLQLSEASLKQPYSSVLEKWIDEENHTLLEFVTNPITEEKYFSNTCNVSICVRVVPYETVTCCFVTLNDTFKKVNKFEVTQQELTNFSIDVIRNKPGWSKVICDLAEHTISVLEYDFDLKDVKYIHLSDIHKEKLPNASIGKYMIADIGMAREDLEYWLLPSLPKRPEDVTEKVFSYTGPLRISYIPIRFESRFRWLGFTDPKHVILINVARDITPLRYLNIQQQDHQLLDRETQELLQLLCDNADIYMGVVKVLGDFDDFVHLYMNPACRTAYPTNIMYRPTGEFMPKTEHRITLERFRDAKIAGRGRTVCRERFFENTWVVSGVTHVRDNIYIFTSKNVTVTKQLEAELQKNKLQLEATVERRTRELQEALDVKSKFLAIMSHEIRTPLSGILASMNFLADTNLEKDQQDLVHTAQICGEQLLHLINDILDIAKMQENKMKAEMRVISVRSIVEESVEIVSINAEQKSLEIIVDIPISVPDSIIADSERLRQILVNLLSNSIKFSSSGEIIVSAQVQSQEGNKSVLLFTVLDHGIGIQKELQKNIFQPFYQADITTSRKFGGTGLGLTISKRLVELHDGDIWFTSTEGEGTTFYFTINVELGAEKEEDNTWAFGRVAIIWVQNQSIAKVLGQRMKEWGLFTIVCDSVESAENAIRENKVDLMLVSTSFREFIAKHNNKIDVITIGTKPLPDNLFFVRTPVREKNFKMCLKQCLKCETLPQIQPQKALVSISTIPILVAEDNALNQRVILRMLKTLGYCNVTLVDDGQKAIDAAKEKYFQIILMDCMMPNVSGLEATATIRKEIAADKQPIIVALTADAFQENAENCLAVGMQKVLTKPVNIAKLGEVLKFYTNVKL